MGYTTEFRGYFELSRPATADEIDYINTFSSSRRMKRDVNKLNELYGGKHGLPGVGYGFQGEYFCKDDGDFGQKEDGSILDYNCPPTTQPGLWCQWVLSEDGTRLEWDGGEKFYNYEEWLRYMIERFFSKWGVALNGRVDWRGEDFDDTGIIEVEMNIVKVLRPH